MMLERALTRLCCGPAIALGMEIVIDRMRHSLLAQPAVRAACLVKALSRFSAFLMIPQFPRLSAAEPRFFP